MVSFCLLGVDLKRETMIQTNMLEIQTIKEGWESRPNTKVFWDNGSYRFRWTESLEKVLKKGLKKVTELKKIGLKKE